MEIRITTRQILYVLHIASWVLFLGLCVEAGALLVNTVITLFINPPGVKNFWEAKDYLIALHQFDTGHFATLVLVMDIVAVLKALMFYLIARLFARNQFNPDQPFSPALRQFTIHMAYLSAGIGLFASSGANFTRWLAQQGLPAADLTTLKLAGADVWLFMAVILFVIVQLVKRGIEIQTENDLTI